MEGSLDDNGGMTSGIIECDVDADTEADAAVAVDADADIEINEVAAIVWCIGPVAVDVAVDPAAIAFGVVGGEPLGVDALGVNAALGVTGGDGDGRECAFADFGVVGGDFFVDFADFGVGGPLGTATATETATEGLPAPEAEFRAFGSVPSFFGVFGSDDTEPRRFGSASFFGVFGSFLLGAVAAFGAAAGADVLFLRCFCFAAAGIE